MERLTSEKWRNADLHGICGQEELCAGRCEDCLAPSFFVRAAKYEDSGMTPEQCEAAKTLIASTFADDQTAAERIRELLKADKEGRVVVLACKAGDTVYSIFGAEIIEKTIGRIIINGYTNPQIWVDLDCSFMTTATKRWDLSVGRDFYLTREEAEKALEARKDG